MDVRMPDGTIIRNVPEGTPKEAILAKYQRSQGGLLGKIDAAVRGAADTMTGGGADELSAGVQAPFRAVADAIKGRGFDLGRAYDAGLAAERGIDAVDAKQSPVARGIGQVAGAIVGPGGKLGMAEKLLPRVLGNAAYGAAYGFGSGEGGFANRAANAGTSAALNVAGGELGRGLVKGAAAVARGAKRLPEAQALMDAGVPLTIGQQLGGMAKTAEDKLANTLPFGGSQIAKRRDESLSGFTRATVQKALDPIGVKLPMKGSVQDAVGFMQEQTGKTLEAASQNMVAKVDNELGTAIANARQAAQAGILPPELAKQLDGLIANNIERRLQGDTLAGREFQQARSEMRRLAAAYGTAQDPAQRELGTVLADLADEIERSAERHSAPQAVDAFRRANLAYAARTRVERAAANAAGNAGEASAFTPNQLMTAVRQGDRTARKGATARGEALLQDMARQGVDVLPSRIGDSGTAGRMWAMAALTGLGGGATMMGADPEKAFLPLALGLGARGVYTPAGQRAVAKALFNRSPLVLQAGNRLGQVAAPLGAGTGALFMGNR